jgi:M6 family metalloprotease-like protein
MGRGFAQIYPPAEGVELPEGYFERLQADPAAFEFEGAWIHLVKQVRANREAYLRNEITLPEALSRGGIRMAGTKYVPVLTGKFANTGANPYPASDLQTELFDGPWPTGTMTQYYSEISYGNMNLTGTVTNWVTVSHNDTYYEGSSNGLGSDAETGEFLKEVLDLNDAALDFGQFDNDGPDGIPNSGDDDGYADFVAFVHPESGGECGNSNIWSHRWVYSGWWGTNYRTNDQSANGGFIWVRDYVIQPAFACDNTTMIQIGVFCHEFGHAFGLPDLYDTDGSSEGIGHWGLMASGSWNSPSKPAHMSPWCKEELGWVIPTVITPPVSGADSRQFSPGIEALQSLPNVEFNAEVKKVWATGSPGNEYFLIENRQNTGFDVNLHASGLVIWHIDNAKTNNQQEWYPPLDPVNHYMVATEQADGTWDLEHNNNRGDSGDPFSLRDFDCGTIPNSDSYTSGPSLISVRNISAPGDPMTFDIFFNCDPPDIDVSPASFDVILAADASVTENLTIANTAASGASNLNWQISKQKPVLLPGDNRELSLQINFLPSHISSSDLFQDDYVASLLDKHAPDTRSGPAVTEGTGGPDGFGYIWIDSNEPGGPLFNWIDISATGNLLSQSSPWISTGSYAGYDEGYIQVPLPFSFNFYGIVYTSIYIGSNGHVSFQAPTGDTWSNQSIPNIDNLNNMIAAFWDDLQISGTAAVYYGLSGSNFVIQYTNVPRYGSTTPNYTYEYILKPTGDMLFQYLSMGFNGGTLTSSTVGIENSIASTGLQIAFNTAYLSNDLAVLIQTVCPWLTVSPASGSLAAGSSANVGVTMDATDLTPGIYNCNLVISSNDPDENPVTVPVQLTVTNGLVVNAKVFLEGPYNAGSMNTYLCDNALLPTNQPFSGSPWNYNGAESVGSLPTGVVDWVLLELQDSPGGSVLSTRAAFVKDDGTIVDMDGSSPVDFLYPPGSYHIVVRHRNHLAVMSANPLVLSETSALYDFTTGQFQGYGTNPMKLLEAGVYGMIAGDGNSDGSVAIVDRESVWSLQNGTEWDYTKFGDFNLDGGVDATDLNLYWRENENSSTQVPGAITTIFSGRGREVKKEPAAENTKLSAGRKRPAK